MKKVCQTLLCGVITLSWLNVKTPLACLFLLFSSLWLLYPIRLVVTFFVCSPWLRGVCRGKLSVLCGGTWGHFPCARTCALEVCKTRKTQSMHIPFSSNLYAHVRTMLNLSTSDFWASSSPCFLSLISRLWCSSPDIRPSQEERDP